MINSKIICDSFNRSIKGTDLMICLICHDNLVVLVNLIYIAKNILWNFYFFLVSSCSLRSIIFLPRIHWYRSLFCFFIGYLLLAFLWWIIRHINFLLLYFMRLTCLLFFYIYRFVFFFLLINTVKFSFQFLYLYLITWFYVLALTSWA